MIRIDVEVSQEHNPRQYGRRERVELTITSRGPATIHDYAWWSGLTIADAKRVIAEYGLREKLKNLGVEWVE